MALVMPMGVRGFLLAIVLVVSLGGCRSGEAPPAPHASPQEAPPKATKPPNILLISLDACRVDRLSMYGCHRPTTPFLDALAKRGVTFTHAFVNTFGTTTSHTTMLSSLYQESHRVEYAGDERSTEVIPTALLLLPEILKAHGYVTLAVTSGGRMGRDHGFSRGFVEYWATTADIEGQATALLERIRYHASEGRPIFAMLHTYEIHTPYDPPEDYRGFFGEFSSSMAPTSDNVIKMQDRAEELSEADMDFLIAMYDGEIRFTDDALGAMFARLEPSGFLEHCVVVITSDHGEEFGEHGGLGHRALLFDVLLRVPLIVFGTGIPEGQKDDRMVGAIDIFPTILGRTGIEPPLPLDGDDLFGSVPVGPDRPVFAQCGIRQAMRTRYWKLAENRIRGRLRLNDLRSDPMERHNVARNHPEQVAQMQRRLEQWREQCRTLPMPIHRSVTHTEEEKERLRVLGYLDD